MTKKSLQILGFTSFMMVVLMFMLLFLPKEFTINFETNGGTEIETLKISANSVIDKSLETHKEGYDFVGWYTEQEYLNKWDLLKDPVIDNLTLYAKFDYEPASYSVMFILANGLVIDELTVVEDSKITAIDAPTNVGLEFIGWFDIENDSQKFDFNQEINNDLILIAKYRRIQIEL